MFLIKVFFACFYYLFVKDYNVLLILLYSLLLLLLLIIYVVMLLLLSLLLYYYCYCFLLELVSKYGAGKERKPESTDEKPTGRCLCCRLKKSRKNESVTNILFVCLLI